MGKTRKRWLLLAVAVAAVAAAAGTAYGGGKATKAAPVIVDGTTGTVVNLDPANQYDYDSFTVDLNMYQGLYGFPNGAKLAPVLSTGCTHSKNLKTWTCGLRQEREVLGRQPDDVGRREVVVRPRAEDQGRPGHLDAAERPCEHATRGKYKVVFHLKAPFSIWPYILSTNAGVRRREGQVPGGQDPRQH